MNHVTHMDGLRSGAAYIIQQSALKCEWVVSHMLMSHVTHTWMHIGWVLRTYPTISTEMWMGHVTHDNESCHTHMNAHRSGATYIIQPSALTCSNSCNEEKPRLPPPQNPPAPLHNPLPPVLKLPTVTPSTRLCPEIYIYICAHMYVYVSIRTYKSVHMHV